MTPDQLFFKTLVNIMEKEDTPESLQKRVMEEAEWELLPEAIKLFSEGMLLVDK